MAYKQQYKGLSRASDGKGFTLSELEEKTKKEKTKSKEQALKLPQIEKPGFDYEMDQDMSYPGGERGRDYDEEGTKYSMSRKASALNKNKLNRKERKMVRQHMKGGDVKPRNPFTEVDPKKVLTEINTRKENKS